ncbi:carbon-nitrogen hydrolase family protein [Emticicia sp. C21]|uniref:carbon-nitrogen hydrolase family protein n=1 Tax=Emticicia sp. C21 TaxID=2302915 RepID=UPI000E35602F|nr:carbon-nitrogen hydrolase family protein [Emticicia sp. C21]RFS17810.1 carbon-nitrogen hydrolase family protein [Emticicia sp. C21]
MKICLAQTKSVKGDILANIAKHQHFIQQAIVEKAEAIFFHELSLTGYEPELAESLATTPDDNRFAIFQQMSDNHGITIGLGMPIRTAKGIEITMLIFQTNQPLQSYAKQQLHADELPYFVEGHEQLILWPETLKVAPAICYESLQASHVQTAHALGARVYLASVAKSQKGVDKAYIHYPIIARQYQMPVLMVNCVGYCDNFVSMGSSGFWNAKGELVAALDHVREGLLTVDLQREQMALK